MVVGSKIFKFAHWMVLLGLFSMVLMDQLRRLGPPLPWLKLSQSSTFLTGMDSLVSKWPEKVKKLLIGLCLASKWSTAFQKMANFTESAQLTWFGFDDSVAMFKLANQILFFSGHLDMEQPTQVKQFQNWCKIRHWSGCPKFWYSQIVAKFKQVTHTSLAQIVSNTYFLFWVSK